MKAGAKKRLFSLYGITLEKEACNMQTLQNTYIESYLRLCGVSDNRIIDFILLSLKKNNYTQDCNYEHYLEKTYFSNK